MPENNKSTFSPSSQKLYKHNLNLNYELFTFYYKEQQNQIIKEKIKQKIKQHKLSYAC